jgi:hypothetical protein
LANKAKPAANIGLALSVNIFVDSVLCQVVVSVSLAETRNTFLSYRNYEGLVRNLSPQVVWLVTSQTTAPSLHISVSGAQSPASQLLLEGKF